MTGADEALRLAPDGFYVRGVKVADDKEVYQAFKNWLADQSKRSETATSEPAQDWKDIFEVYRETGCSDAWLYQQIEAHAKRASPSAIRRIEMPTQEEILLACGEMTIGELRTVKAALKWFVGRLNK